MNSFDGKETIGSEDTEILEGLIDWTPSECHPFQQYNQLISI